jgi:drug/metabolite transporter (DMT)-like permease
LHCAKATLNEPTMKNKILGAHIAILTGNLIWGINNPITKSLITGSVSPYTLAFFRLAGACVLFWTASIFTTREKVTKGDMTLLFFAAIFGLVINQLLNTVGLSMTSPVDASIIVATLPIVTMILAAIILKEPITAMKVIGVLVGACGAVLLISSNHPTHTGESNLWGNLIVFSAAIAFGLYLTLFKAVISRYSATTCMKWMFLFATILSFPLSYQSVINTDYASMTPSIYLQISFVVIGATYVGYTFIQIAQRHLRPTTLSMYNYLQPIVASLVAVHMGLATFGIEKAVAGILVFAGVYIVTQSKSKAQLDAEKAARKSAREALEN